MVEELIAGRADLWLGVETNITSSGIELTFRLKGDGDYVLHWGLARGSPGPWQAPPESVWPARTQSLGKEAVQTPFSGHEGERQIVIRLDDKLRAPFLVFDLLRPETKRGENNQGKDFYLSLPERKTSAPQLEAAVESEIQNS